jgi:hypothetical protein
MSSILKAFCNHLIEFLEDVIRVFPENLDIKTGKTFIEGIKRVNPRRLVVLWKECVLDLYEDQINDGDLNFFINKNYNSDLGENSSDKGKQIIEDMKYLVKGSSKANQQKAMRYIQNLTKLCKLYFTN